jgi:glycerol uptake facilitator-like aquaporin
MENLIYILSDFFITFYWMYTIYCLIRYRNSISRPEFLGMLFTSFVIIYSIFEFVFLKERPSSVKQVQWITTNFLFGFTFNMIIRTRRSISKILNNFNKK